MRHLFLPFFLVLLHGIALQTQAQTISVVLSQDSVLPWIKRAPDGGYLAHHGNGPSVVKFDANMQQLWSVDLSNTNVASNTNTYFNSVPDGGALAIGFTGFEPVGMDSVRSKVFVDRISPTGDQTFAKYLNFPAIWTIGGSFWDIPYSYFGNPVIVDQQAESFISLGDGYPGNQTARILNLDPDGVPQWFVELAENQMLLGELTPDEEGGCYFSSQNANYSDNLTIGHILGDGTLEWCNTYSRNNAYFFQEFHLRVAGNGHLVAAGMEGNNLLWMELGPVGAVVSYHLIAQDPAPNSFQDGLLGFGQLANGEWVGLHGSNIGSSLTFLNEDGTWARSYDSPQELHGGWYDRLWWSGLSTLDGEFTVSGIFRRQEAVFNFLEQRPTLTTFLQGPLNQCLLVPGNAAHTSIPPASINVVTNSGFLTALQLPEVVDIEMQLTEGGVWPTSGLCELATAVADPEPSGSGIRLLGNPVASGGAIVLETDIPVNVVVMDLTGRAVSGMSAQEAGRVEVPAIGLAAGVYLVSARDRTGIPVFTQPVVVQ